MDGWANCVLLLLNMLVLGDAVLSYDPQINYFDGASYTDNCRSKLERRVSGLSGLLISHQLYGSFPYNASKNCFLLITAPVGYRIRLRVLDFSVLGDPHNCDKDTLHVFDHEKAIDPAALHGAAPEDTSPGPIVGQFCGVIKNASELAISSENALTLWWHSDADLPPNHAGEGFRLLWSAFRKANTAPCNTLREFTCANQECIPSELACNRYPDCKDESDLSRERQIVHRCDYLDDDPLGSLTGLTLLLICMAVVSCCACMCICACVCCRCMKAPDKACNASVLAERTPCCAPGAEQPQPTPPGFYPPSPPKPTPSNNATALTYSPQRTRITSGLSLGTSLPLSTQQIRYSKQPGSQYPHAVIVANEYGSPTEHANRDYTYPRNENRHLLI